MSRLLTLEEAQARVLERVLPLEEESVPLRDAVGRVLVRAATATTDLPPFMSSAMDGYAVRADDTPGGLTLVGESAAGRPASLEVREGVAVAIATGAPVPAGADSVVPLEYVVHRDNKIEIAKRYERGANVRPRGGDARGGDVVVAAGERVGAAQVGALAAAGVAEVDCRRRPRVVVLATGTELRRPGEPLRPGEIYDANTPLLAAAAATAGAAVATASPVTDDPDEHRRALAQGLESDVLLTSGGVSVGPHDLVRAQGRALGVEEVFWGVAVKPGKPMSFGTRGRTLVFGLPGNPVSVLVGFELFVRPALLALQGFASPLPVFRTARLTAPLRRDADRDVLVRARSRVTEDGTELEPLRGQESHMIVRAAAADALVLVRRGAGEVAAGGRVHFLPLT